MLDVNSSMPVSDDHESVLLSVVFPALYSLLFAGGLVLNCLAAWIFFKIRTRSSFILYLKNITVADFLMILTFPLLVVTEADQGPWQLHAVVCRYSAVIFYTSMYIGIIFLGLVSLDRFLKIVRPFGHSRLYSYSFTRVLSAGVWVFMISLSLPNTILTDRPLNASDPKNCMALKSELGKHWHTAVSSIDIFIFAAVLVTLLICYVSIYLHVHRSNAKFVSSTEGGGPQAKQNISVVLVVFFVCFVPYHLCRIPYTRSQVNEKVSEDIKYQWMYVKKVVLFLSSCNVCLDPIIYFLMCKSFTRRLKAQLGMKRTHNLSESRMIQKSQVRRFREYPAPV
ncbi:G-protein coupled receptor 87-like isoform X2 [Conger conger]|uniref:G-protein coupled receptor 87-like isoform X2 n=1 Tax=Conger conger TaxID=82655 RepID=UPI002A5A2A97|nr:G-protein coupled receptor 87-like isoform X2 [Conger conger]